MKKLLSTLLAMLLIISAIPLGAFSFTAGAATSGYYTYTVSNGGATITDCDNSISGSVTIPSTLGGYPVTSIGDAAFSYCTSLASVTIPDSVTRIGYGAFRNCTSLTSVTIPDSVTSIGGSAFSGCDSLASVTIPDSVTSISSSAFSGCDSLASVTIGDSVTSIGENAFYRCTSLTSITIPDSVTSIGDSAFCYCTSLTAINVDENNGSYCSVDGVLFNKDKTTLVQYPSGKTNELYTVPDGVTSIGKGAFLGCSDIMGIAIPESVTSLSLYALGYCKNIYITDLSAWCSMYIYATSDPTTSYCAYFEHNLYLNNQLVEELVIPDDVTSIGNLAFSQCTSLKSVVISKNVTQIGISAFWGCSNLEKIIIEPKSNCEMGTWAFYNLENITDMFYVGTQGEKETYWKSFLSHYTNVTWHYNTCEYTQHLYSSNCDSACDNCEWTREVTDEHIYDNACDSNCNGCGKIRYVSGHSYTNQCDTTCNICGEIRTVTHIYSNACDDSCNICGETRTVPDHIYSNDKDIDCNACGAIREVYKLGDINDDTSINNKDLGLLMQYLNDWEVKISLDAADVNADGNVNNKDYGLLMQYLNGWDVVLK